MKLATDALIDGEWIAAGDGATFEVTDPATDEVVEDAAAEEDRALAIEEVTGHGVDHPVTFPQGRYLKAVFAAVG